MKKISKIAKITKMKKQAEESFLQSKGLNGAGKRKLQTKKGKGAESKRRKTDGQRQYYHSRTSQPITKEELALGVDSDDEVDCEKFAVEDKRALEEFVDVASEEKYFMHLWNCFVFQHPIYSDGYTGVGCKVFAEHHKAVLATPSMRRCLVLHLVNLFDWNVVKGEHMENAIRIVDSFAQSKGIEAGGPESDT